MRPVPILFAALLALPVLPAAVAWGADAPAPNGRPPAARRPTTKPHPVVGFANDAADAVEAAVAAKDEGKLVAAAAATTPDAWNVVDTLLARGRPEPAVAFARAYAGLDAAALRAYVAARRGVPDDPEVRRRVTDARSARAADRPSREVLSLLDALEPPDGSILGVMLLLLRGGLLANLGRDAEALPVHEAAIERARTLGWLRAEFIATGAAGSSAYEVGDHPRALAHFQRRLAHDERIGDTKAVAVSLGNLANVMSASGDLDAARAAFEKAIELRRATGDLALVANSVGNLAGLWFQAGDYPRAVRLYREAVDGMRAAGDRAGTARFLGNLANLQASLGAIAKAFELHEEALAEYEAIGHESGTAFVLGALGDLDASLGRTDRALKRLERALEIHRRLGQRGFAARLLISLAAIRRHEGELEEALRLHEESLTEAVAGGDTLTAGRARVSMARTLRELGRTDRALEAARAGHADYEKARNRFGVVSATIELGTLLARGGQTDEAAKVLDRAVREAERLRADRLLVAALGAKAGLRLGAGDHRAALEVARQATQVVDRMFTGLGGEQAAAARESVADVFDLGVRAAAAGDDPAELAYFVENGRAGALMEALGVREAALRADLPEDLRRAREQALLAESAATAAHARALRSDDLAASRAAAATLDAARARSLEVAERIERASQGDDRWDHRGATLDELQARLSPGHAWVAWAFAGPDTVALVATRDAARVVRLAPARDVEAACAALDASDPSADPTAALERLDELLVRPLGLGTDVRTLLVSPAGPICYVPLSVLLRGRDVTYLPSGTTWLYLQDQRPSSGVQVLAVGDPEYGAIDATAGADVFGATPSDGAEPAVGAPRRGGRLAPLPQTRVEVEAVGDVKLLGRDASETGLRRALASAPRWKSVHLACHGLVDRNEPLLSALALTPSEADDGFLTASEVLSMSVPADLVVLSACETGTGKVRRGEGLSGLMRSFLFAGTPRVVCSLWKVDDAATRALMVRFYELWNPRRDAHGAAAGATGSSPAPTAITASEALRAAQEHVRAQPRWRHPYYWAAWVLWGLP